MKYEKYQSPKPIIEATKTPPIKLPDLSTLIEVDDFYENNISADTYYRTLNTVHDSREENYCRELPIISEEEAEKIRASLDTPTHKCPEKFHCGEFPAVTDQDLEEYKASGLPMDPNPFIPERFRHIVPKNNYQNSTLFDGTPYHGPIVHGLCGEEPQLTEKEKQEIEEYQQRRYQEFLAEVAREQEQTPTLEIPVVRESIIKRIFFNLLK